MIRSAWLAVLVAASAGPGPLWGQEAAAAPAAVGAGSDTTGGADLGPLCADRPTKSTAPCTVPAGHFQIESDLFNVTVDHSGGGSATTWLVTNPTLKYGVSSRIDIEAAMVPFAVVTVGDPAGGRSQTFTGVGDLYLKAKWNLVPAGSGAVAFTLAPFLKLPTAKTPIGNGAVEGGVIAPMSLDLPLGLSLTIDPEIDILRDEEGSGYHINTSGLLSFSRAIGSEFTASAEVWSNVNLEPSGQVTQASVDLGLAWIPRRRPSLQLDGGVNLGFTAVTPGVQAYVGISHRF